LSTESEPVFSAKIAESYSVVVPPAASAVSMYYTCMIEVEFTGILDLLVVDNPP